MQRQSPNKTNHNVIAIPEPEVVEDDPTMKGVEVVEGPTEPEICLD